MKKFLSSMMAVAVSATFAVSSIAPAMAAAPMVSVAAPAATQDIQKVSEKRWIRNGNREWRRGDRGRHDRRWGDRGGSRHYWNGHRGSNHWRKGYRRHNNGWWYPLAAFGAGAIIGNTLSNQPRVIQRSYGNSHVQWCYNRYRSYRASDNTFQPYNGPRRQCYSPYS